MDADENHQVEQTSCGVGACVSSGNARCDNGRIVDSCLAGQPSQSDDNCNLVDEDYQTVVPMKVLSARR